MRVIVYEGDAEKVLRSLTGSLPDGVHHYVPGLTIRVTTLGDLSSAALDILTKEEKDERNGDGKESDESAGA